MENEKFLDDLFIYKWIREKEKTQICECKVYNIKNNTIQFEYIAGMDWLIYNEIHGGFISILFEDLIKQIIDFKSVIIICNDVPNRKKIKTNIKDLIIFSKIQNITTKWKTKQYTVDEIIDWIENEIPFYKQFFENNIFLSFFIDSQNFIKNEILDIFFEIETLYHSEDYYINNIIPFINEQLKIEFPNQSL